MFCTFRTICRQSEASHGLPIIVFINITKQSKLIFPRLCW